MQYRTLGRTGWNISTISFGAWAIGGTWGPVDDAESMAALHAALDRGVNFFDTADVYGDGRSERLLAKLKKVKDNQAVMASGFSSAGNAAGNPETDGLTVGQYDAMGAKYKEVAVTSRDVLSGIEELKQIIENFRNHIIGMYTGKEENI